jgi:hypothetical protein
MPNLAFCHIFLQPFLDIKVFQLVPGFAVKPLQQVEIYIVHLKSVELLGKDFVHVFLLSDFPGRHFGGESNLFSVPILQGFANCGFASSLMINIGSVDVVDSVVYRVPNHLNGFFLVHVGFVASDMAVSLLRSQVLMPPNSISPKAYRAYQFP